jgi:hypothetical protein
MKLNRKILIEKKKKKKNKALFQWIVLCEKVSVKPPCSFSL